MCDNIATSSEHVPPKCLFPEQKDLSVDIDLRKNLLKVPSCDAHNSQKSNDDEFFLYVLCTSFQINEIGLNQYQTKIRRATKRNSSILGKIASTAIPVKYKDPNTNKDFYGENPEVFKYQAIEVEHNRIMRLHFYENCKILLIFNR